MADWPTVPPLPLFLHTWTRWGAAWEISRNFGPITASNGITWPAANRAIYVPMWIPWPYPVVRVFWVVGSANTATNMDFGIFTASGTKIYSTGSTAEGTVSTTQYTTPTQFVLAPGRYYFALSCSTTTASCGGVGTVAATALSAERQAGLLQEASLPLPATMTGVAMAASCVPLCGVTRTPSGF